MTDESLSDTPSLFYVSGAPRISTDPEGEAAGPRSHVVGVIEGFRALGWDVATYVAGDHFPKAWTGKGSEEFITSGKMRALATDVARFGVALANRRAVRKVAVSKPDWVYERVALFQALGRPLKRHGVPWILETNQLLFEEASAERKSLYLKEVARKMETSAYRDCDVLVCVSEALRQLVVRRVEVDPAKILVVPNGVDVVLFDPAKGAGVERSANFTVGFVGRCSAWQALELLFRAVEELRGEGIAIDIDVVGEGAALTQWREAARPLGDRVRFRGMVKATDVPSCISRFDFGYAGYVPPRGSEMYMSPLKIYEYMSMGKPVLASDSEDARRVVRNGETGFTFPAGDYEAIRSALRTAYEARDRAARMGAEARRSVLEHHTWRARVEQTIRGSEEILGAGLRTGGR